MDAPAPDLGLSGQASRGEARLALTFKRDGRGRTFLDRQYASYPFHVCKTLYQDEALPGMGTIYTQSCAGGLFEGDRHTVEITAAAGSQAHVTTQASTIVHSMEQGRAQQHMLVRAEAGSFLEVLPNPQILFPHAFYCGTARIIAGEGATVLLSESFLTHDPDGAARPPRAYRSEIVVEQPNGRLFAIDRLRMDEETFRLSAPGTLGMFRACGTLLVIAPGRMPLHAALPGVTGAGDGFAIGMSLLPRGAGQLFRVLASDGVKLSRALFQCWSWSRLALTGSPPRARRK
jgi:urease accessory protein